MTRVLSGNPKAVAARRRRQKAKLSLVPEESNQVAAGDTALDEIAEVEIQALTPAAPQSFAQRMLSRFSGDGSQASEKKSKQGRKKKVEVNFLTSALPMVTGVLASYGQTIARDPYKPLSPKQAEVTAVLAPIFRIIERRMEFHAELTEDELDLIASGTALLGYVGRAYVTYVDIKNKVEEKPNAQTAAASDRERANNHDGASTDPAAREAALIAQFGRSEGQAAVSRILDDIDREHDGHIDGLQTSHDAPERSGNPAADGIADRSWELATVAKAFKRDYHYRSQNGLL